MAEKSIIIIGAGMAGLATGCYGRMNGYRTHILEHHSEPGGVAKAWKHKDYLIDGGIHYLMGHRPGLACHEIYRELGIFHNRTYPDLRTTAISPTKSAASASASPRTWSNWRAT